MERVLQSQILPPGTFNAYIPRWNKNYGKRRKTAGLDELIATHDLICNGEERKTTWLKRRKTTVKILRQGYARG